MPSASSRSLISRARPVAVLLIAALVLAGCVGSGPGGSGGPSSSPASTAAPSSPASGGGFYLRAWQTQALAPQYTFGWLAPVTISDGQFIDGNIAIPAIYPGPIYLGPQSRPISDAGIAAIVAEARKDGLLADKTDFATDAAPGSVTTHIELKIDGVTRELTGPLPTGLVPDSSAPGTPAAYQLFWNQVTSVNSWLAADLGQGKSFTPTSLAVLVMPPTDATAGIAANEKTWPLASTFATFGKPHGGSVYRCATVTGADAATLLAVVVESNQLTHFTDSAGAKASLRVRAILPGEPDPCL
jgi:hypothetical protein